MRLRQFFNSLLIISVFTGNIFADTEISSWNEYTQKIEETFSFSTDSPDILISNKYGEVNIVSSDRKDAHFEVVITVEAKSRDRADQIFDKININLDGGNTRAQGITEFKSKKGWGWTKKNEKYKIDYLVHLPTKADLEIRHKYGDFVISNHTGNIDLNLKYGNGVIQDVEGALTLKLGYVDRFTVGEITGGIDLACSYSDLNFDRTPEIEGETKYSNISFEHADEVDLISKYDHLKAESIGNLNIEGKYNEFDIGNLGSGDITVNYTKTTIDQVENNAEFVTRYGSVNIGSVSNSADLIDIESNYTSYRISGAPGINLDIDTKYVDISYPDNLEINYRDQDSNELKLKGKSGSAQLTLKATMKYGALKIKN